MSLILSSPVAPQAASAPATSQAGRNDGKNQNDSDSFSAVLERSQTSTKKTPEKTSAQRHPRGQSDSEKIEQPDPAAALALAFIALEPRLAAVPASTAPSGPASAVAAALGTDADLSAAQGALPTLGQSAQEQLVPQLALAAPAQQDAGSPVLLANAATISNANAAIETSPRLSTPQIGLAAANRDEPAKAALSAKDTAADVSTAVTQGIGKIADQVMMPDTRTSAQKSKQDDTATESRDGKFSAKPELRHTEAPVAASIADPAATTKANTAPADQFDLSATAPINPANILPQSVAGPIQQAAATPVSLPLAPPIGSSEWGDALGKQIVWMGNANHQIAELQLNPAGLGPLKVTLTINNHQAEALFVSAHPAVRAAVEAALPQLRTNLADNGISLGNTSVSADTQQQSAFAQDQANQSSQRKYSADSVSMPNPLADLSILDAAPAIAGHRNNVDTFA